MSEAGNILKYLSLTLLSVLLIVPAGHTQCPAYDQYQTRYTQASRTAALEKKISQLEALERQWNQCKLKPDSLYCEITIDLAYTYFFTEKKTLGIATIKKTLDAVSHSKLKNAGSLRLKVLYYYAAFLNQISDEKAKEYLEECVTESEKYKNFEFIPKSCAQLSYSYNDEGNFEASISYSKKGIKYAQLSKNIQDEIINSHQLASTYHRIGQNHEAGQLLACVITLLQQRKSDYGDYVYLLAGQNYLESQKFPEAKKHLELALSTSRAQNNLHDLEDDILLAFGNLYNRQEEFEKAIYYYKKTLSITTDTREIKSLCHSGLGSIYYKQKKFDASLDEYNSSVKTLCINLPINTFSNPVISQKNVVKKTLLYTTLKEKVNTELSAYLNTNKRVSLPTVLNTLFTLDQVADNIRLNSLNYENKLQWRKYIHDQYEVALHACLLKNDVGQAFYFLEKSRAVLLNDRLKELSASQKLSVQDSRKEKVYIRRIEKLKLEIETNDVPARRDSLELALEMALREQQRFIRAIEKTNPVYYRYKYANRVPSLKAVRDSLLAPDQAFISYFIGDSVIYALGITKENAQLRRISLGKFKKISSSFLKLCSQEIKTRKDQQELQQQGYYLNQHLLASLNIRKPRIIISFEGVFLPFEAFSASSHTPNDYLLHKHAFSYTYSAGFLMHERPTHQWMKNFMGFAPETFAPTLKQAALHGSAAALGTLENYVYFPRNLTHQQATKQAFLSEAGNYRILQLYTHANADSTSSYEPVLYFADSALKLSELDATRQFKTQLLVLSACNTGVGADEEGEGVNSLARGFAALGIPSIITTLWSVQDNATYTLIESFYRYLKEGYPQDVALQKAKLDYLSTHEDALPYHWSGLIQIGNTKSLNESSSIPTYAGISAAVVLIGAGLFWQRRRKKSIRSSHH